MATPMARAKLTPARLTACLVILTAAAFMFIFRMPGNKAPAVILLPAVVVFIIAGLADALDWETRGGRKAWRFLTVAQAISALLLLYGFFWRMTERQALFKAVAERSGDLRWPFWKTFKFWIEPWDVFIHAGIVFLSVFIILDLITPRDDEKSEARKFTPFRLLDILFIVIVVWTLLVFLWKYEGHHIPWYFFLEMAIGWIAIKRVIRHGWETRGGRKVWRTPVLLQFASILIILAGVLLYNFPLGGSKSFVYDHSFISLDFGFSIGRVVAKVLIWSGVGLLIYSITIDLATRGKKEGKAGE